MNLTRKDKFISRGGLLDWAVKGLGTIASALVKRPIWVWPVSAIVIAIVIASLLMVPQTLTADAGNESDRSIEDCLSCHQKTLKPHDKLGSGNKACGVCHDTTDMKMLRLADRTQVSLSQSPQLCGQCHQGRYQAWKDGTHGIPGSVATVKCTDCHDPHQPRIVLSNITKPHPPAQPDPPSPSVGLQIMLGIVLVLATAVVVAMVTRGERR